MRKPSAILFFTLFIITNSFKTAEEIKWLDFNTGYKLALKKKKMMLVDVYTDWCGWCKVMDRETYAKSEIATLINQHFIPIKFNPETPNIVYTYEGKEYNGKGLRDAIGYKLRERFSFKGNIISSQGQALSMMEVFADFCKHRESFTLGELKMLKQPDLQMKL